MKDAVALAEYLRDISHQPEQVQDFYPTPSTLSTVMYYTGLDPRTMQPVYVPKDPREKAMQRALMQYKDPKNYKLVHEALELAHREDLIGFGPQCLIRPRKGEPAEQKKPAQPQEKKPPRKKAAKRPPKSRLPAQSRKNPRLPRRKKPRLQSRRGRTAPQSLPHLQSHPKRIVPPCLPQNPEKPPPDTRAKRRKSAAADFSRLRTKRRLRLI